MGATQVLITAQTVSEKSLQKSLNEIQELIEKMERQDAESELKELLVKLRGDPLLSEFQEERRRLLSAFNIKNLNEAKLDAIRLAIQARNIEA